MYWGDLRGVRIFPAAQTTKLSVAIGIQREAPNGKTALGTPGPWWVWLSTSLDGVKDRSLWCHQTPISDSPETSHTSFPRCISLLGFLLLELFWLFLFVCMCVTCMCTCTLKCLSADMQVPQHTYEGQRTISSVSCHFVLCLRWRF